MEEEIWKDIEGYDGMYQVSNFGNVRSWYNKRWGRRKEPKIREPSKNQSGYLRLTIKDKKSLEIHRLVALNFVDNPNSYFYVDHIDGNILNNYVSNLRWVSNSQNRLNTKKPKTNTSGYKGVSFCINTNRWKVYWMENGKRKGKSFKTKEEAIEHRRQMVELHYSQDHYVEDR